MVVMLLNGIPDDFDVVASSVAHWWTRNQRFFVVGARSEDSFQSSVNQFKTVLESLGVDQRPFVIDFDMGDQVRIKVHLYTLF